MEYRSKLHELGITAEKSGKYTCPKCSPTRKNKTDKCLSVTFGTDSVLYKCHHCDWSGAVFYREKDTFRKQFKRPDPPAVKTEKQALYQYFEKRCISKETIEKYKIDITDKNQIIFNYFKDGELVNVKTRTNLGKGKKTFTQTVDSEKTFYGMDEVTDFKQLCIVEGEIDCLSFSEAGIEAVSVPQGASENKLECIDNCWEWLSKFESFIIAVDNDVAGDKLKNNLLNRLDKSKCKTINYGQYKDANEVLQSENGIENLKTIIENAEYISIEGIIDYNLKANEIYDFFVEGYTKGLSTGWESLDKIFTIKTGYMMIITGYPSRGKSFFADNLLFNLSKNYDWKHLICSLENSHENHFARFASMFIEKKFNNEKMDGDDFVNSFKFISEHFFRLEVDRLWTIDQIIEQLEYAVRRFGVKTLTIDPYNRLNNNYDGREDKYIGSILSKLSMTAKRLNVLIIFIAHPKKPDGEKQPNMYSISGSPDWYNMADYGIIIHRERNENGELEDKPKITVAKVKDFNIGNPSGGEIYLDYIPSRYKLLDHVKSHGYL